MSLDHQDAKPLYSQIADSFREQILAGTLSHGNKLPSVRQLANELTCNPNTIQRAYRELEAEGWIIAVPGKGNYICTQQEEVWISLTPIWTELDSAVEKLLRAGVPLSTLIKHLKQRKNP